MAVFADLDEARVLGDYLVERGNPYESFEFSSPLARTHLRCKLVKMSQSSFRWHITKDQHVDLAPSDSFESVGHFPHERRHDHLLQLPILYHIMLEKSRGRLWQILPVI
jgi:hypothetical protein